MHTVITDLRHRAVLLWAAAGYGAGTLTLVPANLQSGADDPSMQTDMTLSLAELGS